MNKRYNRILERQLSKYIDPAKIGEMENFLEAVSNSYDYFDNDRILIERSMDISGQELTFLNQQLRENAEQNEQIIDALRNMIITFKTDDEKLNHIKHAEMTDALLLIDFVKAQAELLKSTEENLQLAKTKAEEANQSKSRFLANMSHEIRTPLNAILGFTEYLLADSKNEEQRDLLSVIHNSGETLLKLINDILDLAKIEQRKIDIEKINFNLREMMISGLNPYKIKTNQKNLDFVISFDPEIPEYVNGDPHRIRQAVVNLVSNSIKFTSIGFINIHFELADKSCADPNKFYLQILVSDSGIGVKKEQQEFIFNDFAQADETTTRLYGGTGLGLNIVRQFAQLMNGSVWVESPNPRNKTISSFEGSLFFLELELEIAMPEKENAPIEYLPKRLIFDDPVYVLVAEDNLINQKLIGSLLESMNCKVILSENGAEALKIYNEGKKIDIILMDAQMPVMNGYEATSAIRKLGSKIPIIGVSANVFKDDIEQCYNAGMNAHLGKPYTRNQLYDVIANGIFSC